MSARDGDGWPLIGDTCPLGHCQDGHLAMVAERIAMDAFLAAWARDGAVRRRERRHKARETRCGPFEWHFIGVILQVHPDSLFPMVRDGIVIFKPKPALSGRANQ